MTSLLAAAPFTQYTLTYEAPGTTPGPKDANGNPTWVPTTGTLRALVSPDKARQLQVQPGADTDLVPVTVELLKPLTLPAGVGLGSVLKLTYGGASASITIVSVTPNDLVGVNFGTVLKGDLKYG